MAKAKEKVSVDDSIPEEFANWNDYSSGNGEDVMYAAKGVGKAVRGVVKTFKPGKGNKVGKYELVLTAACDAVKYTGDGDDRESIEVTAEVGDIVLLDDNKGVESLKENIGHEVWVKYVEKIPLDNGGNFWRVKCRVNPVKPKAGTVKDNSENDIPF